MKKYTITDQEWESVLDKVQTLEKENSHLKDAVLSNCYKTEVFSIYTPKDDPDVVVVEDSFKHKRTFDVDGFNKLMGVLHSVQDY